ncbi:MAG: helix-turn-helix domain-containing protein [Deinococcota bacterium]|jgi:excisionase family DNA binding protein|nr:helix-turn-helix domain-containing protein [Deinococcota bacterium]
MKTFTVMTVEEVARLLRVDEASVRRWLREGRLLGVKAGRSWRVEETAVQTFLENEAKTQSEPNWFVAEPEALAASTALGSAEKPGDVRKDFSRYWAEIFASS